MLTLKRLEDICAAARSKGFTDDAAVKFCAGAGVGENDKIQLNEAANIVAGAFLENPDGELVLEAPELVLNQ